jgi:hypothetical protein
MKSEFNNEKRGNDKKPTITEKYGDSNQYSRKGPSIDRNEPLRD